MGLIYKHLTFTGNKGSKVLEALMDNGASRCFIRETDVQGLAEPLKTPTPFTVELGKGTVTIEAGTTLLVHIDGYALPWTFYVFPDLTEEVIIGADFFQAWKIKLDPATEDLILDPQALKIKLV
jgi:hypothetical protein